MVAPYSIVVPVHNEAGVLPQTLPSILDAADAEAELVFVCNGCVDASAEILRAALAGRGRIARVEEMAAASKTAALNRGDELCSVFPRFYLDADVRVPAGCFEVLAAALVDADLVAPRIRFDMAQATRCSRAIAQAWLALPHAREAAFHHLIGLSRAGRSRWQSFPDILGDDIFMEAQTPADRRRIVHEISIETAIPRSFFGWVRVRSRWRRGERELARMGLAVPRHGGQKARLLAMLASPRWVWGAAAFILVRLLAEPLSRRAQQGWFTDRSFR